MNSSNSPRFNDNPVHPWELDWPDNATNAETNRKYEDIQGSSHSSHQSAIQLAADSSSRLSSKWAPSDFAALAVVLFGSILGIWLAVKFVKRLKSLAAAQRAIVIAASALMTLLILAWPSMIEKRYDGKILHRYVSIDPIWDGPSDHYTGPDIKTVLVYILASAALGIIFFATVRQRQKP